MYYCINHSRFGQCVLEFDERVIFRLWDISRFVPKMSDCTRRITGTEIRALSWRGNLVIAQFIRDEFGLLAAVRTALVLNGRIRNIAPKVVAQ